MRAARHFCIFVAAGLVLGGMALVAVAAEPARHVFGAQRSPSADPAQPHGSYAKGCLAGAVALPETGPGWQAMRLGRNRNWGHPEMIAFIERLSRQAARIGWPRLYVGDISQPRGGPMAGGHRSHQTGLDADIWLRIPGPAMLNIGEREEISSHSVVRPDRMAVNGAWRPAHHALIRLAARDPAVARIFVNAAIKQALCAAEPPGESVGDRAWLRKVRSWWGHDSHFHVRLNCPESAPGCVEQTPPPAGDGCSEELAWWFTEEALNPEPPATPRAELTLDDLPQACRATVLR
jgi:penicillin-insensitive murein endopeptidase